jgi:hypothetical protein
MDNFYVTLPSNVKSFSENTIANYKTQLSSRIILNGEWEVGLVEISYTLSWYNSPSNEEIALLYWDKGVSQRISENIFLPPGRYDTIDELLNILNLRLTQFKNITLDITPDFSVEARNRLVAISHGIINNKRVFVELSSNLCDMLGFNKNNMSKFYGTELIKYGQIESGHVAAGNNDFKYEAPTEAELLYKAERPYEINGGYHSLFVYSDVVAPSFVGDSYTQLLRLVHIPTEARYGDQILISYPNTYYIPVIIKEFDTIEIDIKDDVGLPIPFEFGRCIIVLHFRKVNKKNS